MDVFVGSVYNFLTVIEKVEDKKQKHSLWRCSCVCGKNTMCRKSQLATGVKKSCGCKANELIAQSRRTHGKSDSQEWKSWRAIRQRCLNANSKDYARYGGKGITLCDRWMAFENFYEDMGDAPGPEYTVDRIDGTKGYSPDNCRWATPIEQAQNKRSNRVLLFNGELKCVAEWERVLGFPKDLILDRISRGWDVEEALTTPPIDCRKLISFNGKTMGIAEWAREIGIGSKTLAYRIRTGWSIEQALSTPLAKRNKAA